MSTPPSRVTGPSRVGGRRTGCRGAAVRCGAVLVGAAPRTPWSLPRSRCSVSSRCVVAWWLVPVPGGGATGSPAEHAAPTRATATPTARARPNDREGCGIPHCVPRGRGTAVAQPPRRDEGVDEPGVDVGVDDVRVHHPPCGGEVATEGPEEQEQVDVVVGSLDLDRGAGVHDAGGDDREVGAGAPRLGEPPHPAGLAHVRGEGAARDARHLDAQHDVADAPQLADESVGRVDARAS